MQSAGRNFLLAAVASGVSADARWARYQSEQATVSAEGLCRVLWRDMARCDANAC